MDERNAYSNIAHCIANVVRLRTSDKTEMR